MLSIQATISQYTITRVLYGRTNLISSQIKSTTQGEPRVEPTLNIKVRRRDRRKSPICAGSSHNMRGL